MPDSLESIARKIRLYVPNCPLPLAEEWVRDAFREINRRKLWSWAVAESQFTFPASYTTGTVTLTNGSASVTGSGTSWTEGAHKSLQFRKQGDSRIFTVSAVGGTTTLTLDRTWPDDTEADASYEIYQAYVTVPTDFKAFLAIRDPSDNDVRIRTKDTAWLEAHDPERDDTGDPTYLVDLRWSSIDNRPMYEVWPHQKAQRDLVFLYWKKYADISRTQDVPYTVDGDILKNYALAEAADWPGTKDEPNPFFSTRRADRFRAKFEEAVADLIRDDHEIYFRDLIQDWGAYLLYDADYIRAHPLPAGLF